MANYANLKAAINAVIKANGQREITGEVMNQVLTAMVNSLGSNYQYVGVATPSTNPGTPDQNVFYMATQAGTYTNFSAIVLQAGISILLWNGSWTSETFFTIDSVPTAGSNNFITSGAVFDKMKLDGGAYDVTAHNNNATFADLSALLNSENLNTLIPVAVRHGGMSIKFVQSSDNNYVHATLLADEFTTDVTQWQVVEKEPKTISKNLVTSEGIAFFYNGLLKRGGMLDISTDITGKYWSAGGTLSDAQIPYGFYAKEIDIAQYAGKYLLFRCGWAGVFANGCYIECSDSTYVNLRNVATLIAGGQYYKYKIPVNATKLEITYRIVPSEGECYYFVAIDDVESSIEAINDAIEAINDAIGNGYVYAGIATPSSTPTTGKVFYLATQKGTYANYDNIVISEDGLYVILNSNTSWNVQRLVAYEDNAKYNAINPITSDAIYKHFNGLRAFLNFLDITMAQEPSGNGQYYSAGGVLSDAQFPKFYNKAIDITSYAGKYLYIRCGWGDLPNPHWGNGCYVKLSDNTYISLSQQGVMKHSFTNEYDIYKLPDNAVELEITYRYSQFSANCYFVAIREICEEDLLSDVDGLLSDVDGLLSDVDVLKITDGVRADLSSMSNGYWSEGGTITQQNTFYAKAIDVTNYVGCIAKIRMGSDHDSTVPNSMNTLWGFVKFKDNTYKVLNTLTVASYDGKYSLLKITEEMVELEVTVRPIYKEDYFVIFSTGYVIDKPLYALGDSTTYGAGSGGTTSTNGHISWSDRLVNKIKFKSYKKKAVNSTLCMNDGVNPRLYSQVTSLADNSIILVMIGTNDINQSVTLGDVNTVMAADYDDLNDTTNFAMAFRYNMEYLLRTYPHSVIICMMPVSPLGSTLVGDGYLEPDLTLRAKCEQYMDVERQICKYLSIPVVETMAECGITPFAQTQLLVTDDINSPSFMADNYHPNTAGNEKIANLMRSKIIQFCS